MKNKFLLQVVAINVFLTFLLTEVSAQTLHVGQPIMGGNGCPQGTAQAAVLEDGSTVSILFDQFTITGKKGINSWDQMRRFCSFRIPVEIPSGYNLEATSIMYRGFANLPKGARAFVITSGPIADPMGSSVSDYKISHAMWNTIQNFEVKQPLPQNFQNQCRSITEIQFTSILQLFGPAPKVLFGLQEDASVTIDSSDIGGTEEPIRISFRLRPCH